MPPPRWSGRGSPGVACHGVVDASCGKTVGNAVGTCAGLEVHGTGSTYEASSAASPEQQVCLFARHDPALVINEPDARPALSPPFDSRRHRDA